MSYETENASSQNLSIEDDGGADDWRHDDDDAADGKLDLLLANLLLHEGGVVDAEDPDDGERAEVDAGRGRSDLVESANVWRHHQLVTEEILDQLEPGDRADDAVTRA